MKPSMSPTLRLSLLPLALATLLAAQPAKYDGPRPPKPDVPYLVLADTLVSTEVVNAKEDTHKDDTTYTIPGASSSARTPLAEPILILQTAKLSPEELQCYRMEVRNGNRQVSFNKKKRKDSSRPLRFLVTKLDDNLYKLEANEQLENGEYSLSPNGSNQVFCFQIY
jgi:hypothetical protein